MQSVGMLGVTLECFEFSSYQHLAMGQRHLIFLKTKTESTKINYDNYEEKFCGSKRVARLTHSHGGHGALRRSWDLALQVLAAAADNVDQAPGGVWP